MGVVGEGVGEGVGLATESNTTAIEPVEEAGVLMVTVLPLTAVTVVPNTMPGPNTDEPTSTFEVEPTEVSTVEPEVTVADVLVMTPAVKYVGDSVGDAEGAGVGLPGKYVGAAVTDVGTGVGTAAVVRVST